MAIFVDALGGHATLHDGAITMLLVVMLNAGLMIAVLAAALSKLPIFFMVMRILVTIFAVQVRIGLGMVVWECG